MGLSQKLYSTIIVIHDKYNIVLRVLILFSVPFFVVESQNEGERPTGVSGAQVIFP